MQDCSMGIQWFKWGIVKEQEELEMDIQITTQTVQEVVCDALILVATRKAGEAGLTLSQHAAIVNELLGGLITESNAEGEFKGASGELLTLHPMGKLAAKRVIVLGLGKQEAISVQSLQRASATAIRH